MAAAATTATLSFVSVALIAFAGIVAGQNANRPTNPTTEIFESEDATRFRYLRNETTDGSTVRTTHLTTPEPDAVTFKQETSSKPKRVVKLRARSSTTTTTTTTTTVKMETVRNVTGSSVIPDETNATTQGTIPTDSSEENPNAVTKSQLLKNVTITIETSSPTPGTEPTGATTKSDSPEGSNLPRESKSETTPIPTISTEDTTFVQNPENSTLSTEGRDMKRDPIEEELDETINSMPKLPELILSNETHFEFHQNPEEASLDERITQIARQLAETGLRREYEERKLGHFIPISVRPIEYITPSYHSKSKAIKFVKGETQNLKQPRYKSTLLKVLTKTKSDSGNENLDKTAYELVTNLPEILRRNKSEKQIREINALIKVAEKGFSSDSTDSTNTPTNFPTFFELLQASEKGNSVSEPQSVVITTVRKDLTTGGRQLTDDTTYYSYVEMTNNS